MTPTETVRLIAIVRQLWPSMKMEAHTPDAWHLILDDVTLDDALGAVKHLAKVRSGYIAPADIRRQIASVYGLLAPTEAEGLAAAAHVAGQQGVGGRQLHPVVYAAYRAMGGPTAFDAPPSVIRPQWGRVWAECIREHEELVLGGDLGQQVEFKKQLAIEAKPAEQLA